MGAFILLPLALYGAWRLYVYYRQNKRGY